MPFRNPANAGNAARTTRFRLMMLHQMPPGVHIVLSAEDAKFFKETFLRNEISKLNTHNDIFLQVHKNKDGSFFIWHNPNKVRRTKSDSFETLASLRRELEETQRRKNYDSNPNAFLNEMFVLQDKIEEVLNELKTNPGEPIGHKGGSIRQPLRVILEFYRVNEDEWNMLRRTEQTRLWIKAEVAIKKQRDQHNSLLEGMK